MQTMLCPSESVRLTRHVMNVMYESLYLGTWFALYFGTGNINCSQHTLVY